MTKVSNVLLFIITVTLALYGSAKGYLYYKAQGVISEIKTQTLPLGDLTYGGISTSLSGTLTYNKVLFTSRDSHDAVAIDAITFGTPNILYLLGGLSGAAHRTALPDQLQLTLTGLQLDLKGSFMEQLDRLIASSAKGHSVAEQICDQETIGPAQYRALGYQQLISDIQIGYHYYRDTTLMLELRATTREQGEMSAAINLKGIRSMELRRLQSQNMPVISKIELRYQDRGYTPRINQYCAKFKGLSVDEYITMVTNQDDTYYLERWGFAPGNGLRWAYRSYLTNPGKLRIVARPPEALTLTDLFHYSPAAIPSLLGMSIEVNDQLVQDLTISAIAMPANRAGNTPAPRPKRGPDAATAAALYQQQSRSEPAELSTEYQRVAISELKQHADRKVRMVLQSGAIREGWLVAVTGSEIKIEQRHYSGAVSMAVARTEINYIEVQ